VLYAWEIKGHPSIDALAGGFPGDADRDWERLARGVVDQQPRLDREIAAAADHWRLERIGTVERNILRLGVHELLAGDAPAPVVIDEAVRLARWFAGAKAPAFVNGVLDALARRLGRL
jgi:N utilization substance protein B